MKVIHEQGKRPIKAWVGTKEVSTGWTDPQGDLTQRIHHSTRVIDIEDSALAQLKNLAGLPFIQQGPMNDAIYKHPTIRKAAIEIAYDNGFINRFAPEAEVIDGVMAQVEQKFSAETLTQVEAHLRPLSKEALNLVCCGGRSDETEKLSTPQVEEVLDFLFEEM